MKAFACRCEDVTVADIEAAFRAGYTTIEALKRYTGFGTGPCQGKECLSAVAHLCIHLAGETDAAPVPFTSRPPARPVTLAALAALADADTEA